MKLPVFFIRVHTLEGDIIEGEFKEPQYKFPSVINVRKAIRNRQEREIGT